MKEIFFDAVKNTSAIGFVQKDVKVLQAGTTVYSMPVEEKNEEYQRFADEYDIHFIFDDVPVMVDFYAVPRIDIFATDRYGGYIGTVGGLTDSESSFPICYIDKERNVFQLASNFTDFLEKCPTWKEALKPCNSVELFSSKADAMNAHEFVAEGELNHHV